MRYENIHMGFSCGGDGNVRGGHFTPSTIRQKISGLREALDELYTQQAAGRGAQRRTGVMGQIAALKQAGLR
jgi:hypothetical protein